MIQDLLWLTLGIAGLLIGGERLVRGGSNLARRLGVSPLVVGMTIVSFGTSAPELSVNMLAAWSGNGGVSFGNVFGSNMANVGLILGFAALLKPVPIRAPVIRRELPMMLLATAVATVMGLDALWNPGVSGVYDRGDGIVMWLVFGVFLYYTLLSLFHGADAADQALFEGDEEAGDPNASILGSLAWIVLGLVVLVYGGKITVDAAVSLARDLEVPEVLIGLTMIAIGTSLPELVTTVIAVMRGQTDLAVGNVIGSNIFNLLFVLASASVLAPIEVPEGGDVDLGVNATLSTLFLIMSLGRRRRLVRVEGAILIVIYVGYVAWRSLA